MRWFKKKKKEYLFQCNTWERPVFGEEWKPKISWVRGEYAPYRVNSANGKITDVVAKWKLKSLKG